MRIGNQEIGPYAMPSGTNDGGIRRRKETDGAQPITLQEIAHVPENTSLLDFFAQRTEIVYQRLAHALKSRDAASERKSTTDELINSFSRFAGVLDTMTFIPFAQRFDLFIQHVFEDTFDLVNSTTNYKDIEYLAENKTTTLLHIDKDVFDVSAATILKPEFEAYYNTATELFSMSTRAMKEGTFFIPTELHLTLRNALSQPNQELLEWEEIAEQVYNHLGEKYQLFYTPSVFYRFLRTARNELVEMKELGPEHLKDRQETRTRFNEERVRMLYHKLHKAGKHTVPNIMEETGFSDYGVRSRLERLGLEPLLRPAEIKLRASRIDSITHRIMEEKGIPWDAVEYADISKQLLVFGITMSKSQIIDFISEHRDLFPDLYARRTSSHLSPANIKQIFLQAHAGVSQQEIASELGLTRGAISRIIRETPAPIDDEGQPITIPPFEPKRSYSPQQKERILALYAANMAHSGKPQHAAIQKDINGNLTEGERELPLHTIISIIRLANN